MNKTDVKTYNERMSADAQLSAEEWIAAQIMDYSYEDENERPSELACHELSWKILRGILERFRPDFTQDAELPKIQVVVQNGGSSGEWYANSYDNQENAQDFIDDCYNNGAYNCVGPFEVPVIQIPGVQGGLIPEGEVLALLNDACSAAVLEDWAEANEWEDKDEDEDDEDTNAEI